MKLHQVISSGRRSIKLQTLFTLLSVFFASPVATSQELFNCQSLPHTASRASHGDSHAQAVLSKIYLGGRCAKEDDREAKKWAELSAGQGDAEGEAVLSLLLNQGPPAYRDPGRALQLARSSAEKNFIPGIDYLALMLHHGWGGHKDNVGARIWAKKSADQGDAQGEALLALILLESPDGNNDYIEAGRLARLSADQGHSGAQRLLGKLYEFGEAGLPRDYTEADKWFILSMCDKRPDVAGEDLRKRLELTMSAEDILISKTKANLWRQSRKQSQNATVSPVCH